MHTSQLRATETMIPFLNCHGGGVALFQAPSGNTVSGQGLSQVKRRRAGLVMMSLFHLVNMTTKILVAEQSYTHLVTKES